MLAYNVRGNWRDLLLVARAPLAGTQNDEAAAAGDRAVDRYTASAMIDAPEGFARFIAALPIGLGR